MGKAPVSRTLNPIPAFGGWYGEDSVFSQTLVVQQSAGSKVIDLTPPWYGSWHTPGFGATTIDTAIKTITPVSFLTVVVSEAVYHVPGSGLLIRRDSAVAPMPMEPVTPTPDKIITAPSIASSTVLGALDIQNRTKYVVPQPVSLTIPLCRPDVYTIVSIPMQGFESSVVGPVYSYEPGLIHAPSLGESSEIGRARITGTTKVEGFNSSVVDYPEIKQG